MRNNHFHPFIICLILLSFLSLSFRQVSQTQSEEVQISFPGSGAAVQGLVQIVGTANPAGFQSYRLEFAASNNTSTSWFLIHQQTSPVVNDILGEWDTSVLTDGDYSLKLTVSNGTDDAIIVLVEGIRIRNYTPIETDTPAPISEEIAPIPTDTPTPTAPPTATPLKAATPGPTNGVSINSDKLKNAVLVGGALGLFGTLFILIYAGYRQKQ